MATQPLPELVPLTLVRGDTRIWTDTIETNTGTELAPVWVPYDLTGHTLLAQIRATRDRSSVLYATITAVAAVPATGELVLTLTAAEANGLVVPSAWWDLQITRTADSFVRTHLAGKVKIIGDVSHV